MDAGVAWYVLAHVVDADIHQLQRVERAAAEMGRGRGMRGASGEDEIGAGVGERRRHHDFPEARRVPGDGDIGVSEGPGAHHEGFCRTAFFRGAAVIAHAAGNFVDGEPVLHGGGGEQRGGAEQVMAAAVAVASDFDRARFRHAGFLAETRQRIIFAEEGDDGTAFACFAHQRGGNAGDFFGDAKTLMLQLGQMFGRRACLGVADFGHRPDPIGEGDETRLDGVDATPDVTAVIHRPIPILKSISRRDCYQLRQIAPSVCGDNGHAALSKSSTPAAAAIAACPSYRCSGLRDGW